MDDYYPPDPEDSWDSIEEDDEWGTITWTTSNAANATNYHISPKAIEDATREMNRVHTTWTTTWSPKPLNPMPLDTRYAASTTDEDVLRRYERLTKTMHGPGGKIIIPDPYVVGKAMNAAQPGQSVQVLLTDIHTKEPEWKRSGYRRRTY